MDQKDKYIQIIRMLEQLIDDQEGTYITLRENLTEPEFELFLEAIGDLN